MSKPAKRPTGTRAPALVDVLAATWQPGDVLEQLEDLPADTSRATVVGHFADAVRAAAPRWVRLPIDPAPRKDAARYVTSLRNQGLDATLRPTGVTSSTWNVYARAKHTTPAAEQ